MKNITKIEFYTGSKEELLPDFAHDFQYIASHVELDNYITRSVPWHWHKAVELFYIQSGALEYYTPKGKVVFPAGSGGMINSNVLHRTKTVDDIKGTVQLLHIFDPIFISGELGSRIEKRYIAPITASQLEIIALFPEDQSQAPLLNSIRESFHFSESDIGYEIKLRAALSEIWLQLYNLSLPIVESKGEYDKMNEKVKLMMIYIHDHFAEKITVAEIAASAFSSERECFRVFHDRLHMTPIDYIQGYRLQMACDLLVKSQESVTYISQACGMGSSSYFGKVFREKIGCTPLEYRNRWQNNDI